MDGFESLVDEMYVSAERMVQYKDVSSSLMLKFYDYVRSNNFAVKDATHLIWDGVHGRREFSEQARKSVLKHVLSYFKEAPFRSLNVSEITPTIIECFDHFSQEVKIEAIQCVSKSPEREAAGIALQLIRRANPASFISEYEWDPSFPYLLTFRLGVYPDHTDVYFPSLFEYSSIIDHAVCPVFLLCLQHAERGFVPAALQTVISSHVVEAYQKTLQHVRPKQVSGAVGNDRIWEEDYDYHQYRGEFGVFLDLMGYIHTPAVLDALTKAQNELTDPLFTTFLVPSLIRHNQTPTSQIIEIAAASRVERSKFFRLLHSLDQQILMPEKYRTPQALAESQMVHWLTYPTELGRVPDEIECLGKEGDYFVFRYRVEDEDDVNRRGNGWLVGWSAENGSAFSHFEKHDGRPTADYVNPPKVIC